MPKKLRYLATINRFRKNILFYNYKILNKVKIENELETYVIVSKPGNYVSLTNWGRIHLYINLLGKHFMLSGKCHNQFLNFIENNILYLEPFCI